jgi:hypothetical protein
MTDIEQLQAEFNEYLKVLNTHTEFRRNHWGDIYELMEDQARLIAGVLVLLEKLEQK